MDGQLPLPLPSDDTLAVARERVMAERWEKGSTCPCCDQMAKVYARTLYAGLAVDLIKAWRYVRDGDPFQWFHMPTAISHRAGDAAKAAHWGLIEPMPDVRREDGGKAGWWRFTPVGIGWVKGTSSVPRYALIYNKVLQRVDGPPWSIRDALGKEFDLRELLEPTPRPTEGDGS